MVFNELEEVSSLQCRIRDLPLALGLLLKEPKVIQVVLLHCASLQVLVGNAADLIDLTELFDEVQQALRQWFIQRDAIREDHHLEVHSLALVMYVVELA